MNANTPTQAAFRRLRPLWIRPLALALLVAAGAGCEFGKESYNYGSEGGATQDPTPSEVWVDLYYPGWRQNRFPPEAMDLSGVTHIIHFAWLPWIAEGGTDIIIDDQQNGVGAEAAAQIISVGHAAGKKVLISVGGSGRGSQYFNQAMSDASRASFIQQIIAKTVERGYDGIDIDWEPGWENTAAFIPLFQKFSRELGDAVESIAPHLILTTAGLGSAGMTFGPIEKVYDQINIMTYDLVYGTPLTWHDSAITGGGGQYYSIDRAGLEYSSSGVPKAKVGIGLKCGGYIWQNATEPMEDPMGAAPRSVPYTTIMTTHYPSGKYVWDETAKVPYLSIETPSPMFITYDDARSAKAKIDFLRGAKYGGIIIWDSSEQYFPEGDAAGAKQPLMQAIKEAVEAPPP